MSDLAILDIEAAEKVGQLAPVSGDPTCGHCGETFTPRKGSGGKPQKYCSEDCRRAADNGLQSQRGQRGDQRGTDAATGGPEIVGTLITNGGGERMLIPEEQLQRVDAMRDPKPKSDEFDWEDADDVILRRQPETALYFNPYGQIVIRQHSWPDEDQVITIARENLQTIIDRLCDMAGIQGFGG